MLRRLFSSCGVQASCCIGFSLNNRGSRKEGLSSCVHGLSWLRGVWNLPGPEIEPVCPALAGRFLTTGPPGKSSLQVYILILLFNTEDFGCGAAWIAPLPNNPRHLLLLWLLTDCLHSSPDLCFLLPLRVSFLIPVCAALPGGESIFWHMGNTEVIFFFSVTSLSSKQGMFFTPYFSEVVFL